MDNRNRRKEWKQRRQTTNDTRGAPCFCHWQLPRIDGISTGDVRIKLHTIPWPVNARPRDVPGLRSTAGLGTSASAIGVRLAYWADAMIGAENATREDVAGITTDWTMNMSKPR
jgi:hypothetical protein